MPGDATPPARTGGRLSGTTRARATTAPAVGALIPGVLSRLGLGETLERWRAVSEWDAIVGDSLARHARAARIEKDVLVVEVTSSAAMHHVSHFKHELLERLERQFHGRIIRDVRFVLERGPHRP